MFSIFYTCLVLGYIRLVLYLDIHNCYVTSTTRLVMLYKYFPDHFQPSEGVLGTHRKSAVFELIRSGKRFPDGYFWQVEMVSGKYE